MSSSEEYVGLDLVVELTWDEYDTGLFTQKLFRHVKNDEASFELEAVPGSLRTSIGISVVDGLADPVITGIGQYLLNRRHSAEEMGREAPAPTVTIFHDGEEYAITVQGEADAREIRRYAKIKASGEDAGQSSLVDYGLEDDKDRSRDELADKDQLGLDQY